MKKALFLISILFSLPYSMYSAFENEGEQFNYGYGIEQQEPFFWDCPFPSLCSLPAIAIDGNYLSVNRTSFRESEFDDDNLTYRELDLSYTYLFAYDSTSAMTLGAGYVGTEVNMTNNPFFDETHFDYITFTATGITQKLCNWLLKAGGSALVDVAELNLSDYTLYQGFLLGKYVYCPTLHLDAGFICELGLNKRKFWPVFGFNYFPTKRLNIHAVYPLDISAEYFIFPSLSLEGSVRFLRNRHRVRITEPLPMGIFEYRTTGAEFDINYNPFPWIILSGYVGSTFDGDLKVTDRNNEHAIHAKFRGSFYVGGMGSLRF